MLRLFLRLYLLVIVGFMVVLFAVNTVLNVIYGPYEEQYVYELVRGPLHELRGALTSVDSARRPQRLAELQEHYGFALSLHPAGALTFTSAEAQMLERRGVVFRDDGDVFLTPLSDASGQWLELRAPPMPSLIRPLTLAAYLLLMLAVAFFILWWIRPLWRDLEALRDASERMGRGDLQARVKVRPSSGVGTLAACFNHMAARVGWLVENQRQLTDAVSHELRTPIARLAFALEMLESADNRDELIQDMREDLTELRALVAEALEYARLDLPSSEGFHEPVDVASWLEEIIASATRHQHGAEVRCLAPAADGSVLRCDARLMGHALSNLVRNARRHARSRVEVRLLEESGHWHLRVEDDGDGIDAQDRERVFSPFVRLDDSRSRDTGGVGLGLAIVRRVAELHGGSAHATHSATLGGACLEIAWPVTVNAGR